MVMSVDMRFPEGKAKALTLSYDDGVEQDIRLVDILNAHGLKCTFNLNSGLFSPEGTTWQPGTIHRRMTAARALALYGNSAHEVAVHGMNHPFLHRLPIAAATAEIIEDRKNLEAMFGHTVQGMAYPFGTQVVNDQVVQILRDCGIHYARTTESTGNFEIPTDWLRMPATCHHNHPKLMEYAEQFLKIDGSHGVAHLFYLWGHSYEFEEKNNWEVIERFAEYMGGRDDVWYATNGEIYDYVRDWNRMEWSADCKTVTNPSARTLYIRYGADVFEIGAGETRRLV